jgi:hypothetical protein
LKGLLVALLLLVDALGGEEAFAMVAALSLVNGLGVAIVVWEACLVGVHGGVEVLVAAGSSGFCLHENLKSACKRCCK